MATKSISQLDTAESLALGDLFETAIPDQNSATGYTSRKTSLTNIAEFTQSTAANNSLETTAKTVVGAINEVDAEGVKWADNMAIGVKNYFPYPYNPYPKQGAPYTQRNVIFTDEGKGIIKANGINNNTGASYCQLTPTTINDEYRLWMLPPGHYHLSGGISDDYYINISTGLKTSPTDRTPIGEDKGNGVDFEVTATMAENNIFCSFAFVAKGKTADNVIFYPMLTRLEDISSGFSEYAMTNIELTKYKVEKTTIATTETTGTASRAYAVGEYMFWRLGLYKVTASISAGGAITEETNVVQTTIGAELKALFDALTS